jgi:hypothetical protein
MTELSPCQYCKKPPGTKVGPPAMARCVTDGCYGKTLAAVPIAHWNRRAPTDTSAVCRDGLSDLDAMAEAYANASVAIGRQGTEVESLADQITALRDRAIAAEARLAEIAEACERAGHPAAPTLLSQAHVDSLRQIAAKARAPFGVAGDT